MESIEDTDWDVVVAGTGLAQSLLALALSRSGQKVLHVDKNDYYGGPVAALNLQDAEEWVESINSSDAYHSPFSSASIVNPAADSHNESNASLGPARRYTLTLSPRIVPSRSTLLSSVVSSRVEQQLEFVAQGSTWLLLKRDRSTDPSDETSESHTTSENTSSLRKVPSSREDIFADQNVDSKAKRTIIRFLRFVADLDREAQREIWQQHRNAPFDQFLRDNFGVQDELQQPIHALTMSLKSPSHITTEWALRRIEQHLKSMGMLGPGFGAVLPKWGGLAEIVQVGCRAQAVGGGIYMLGHRVEVVRQFKEENRKRLLVKLSTGDQVKTRWLASGIDNFPEPMVTHTTDEGRTSHSISIISAPLDKLYEKAHDESPEPAGAMISIPGQDGAPPVQIIAHASISGECPTGQCILYAVTKQKAAYDTLAAAVDMLLSSINPQASVLWRLQYEHHGIAAGQVDTQLDNLITFTEPPTDLIFDDHVLDSVKGAWKKILGLQNGEGEFLRFPPRAGEEAADEDIV